MYKHNSPLVERLEYATEALLVIWEDLTERENKLTASEHKILKIVNQDLDYLMNNGPKREQYPPLSRKEAAKYLKVSIRTLYNKVSAGKLYQLPDGTFLQSELDKIKYKGR